MDRVVIRPHPIGLLCSIVMYRAMPPVRIVVDQHVRYGLITGLVLSITARLWVISVTGCIEISL